MSGKRYRDFGLQIDSHAAISCGSQIPFEIPGMDDSQTPRNLLGCELRNKPTAGSSHYAPGGPIILSGLGAIEALISLSWPGPNDSGMAGKWSIVVGNTVMRRRTGALDYRALEVRK